MAAETGQYIGEIAKQLIVEDAAQERIIKCLEHNPDRSTVNRSGSDEITRHVLDHQVKQRIERLHKGLRVGTYFRHQTPDNKVAGGGSVNGVRAAWDISQDILCDSQPYIGNDYGEWVSNVADHRWMYSSPTDRDIAYSDDLDVNHYSDYDSTDCEGEVNNCVRFLTGTLLGHLCSLF